MRVLFALLWVAIAAVYWAWHAGPGQDRLQLNAAGELAAQAAANAHKGKWPEAVQGYDAALASLPAEHEAPARELRLERAKARMHNGQLPEARTELGALVDELQADPQAPPQLTAAARQALASAQYYVTWLLRLEGEPAAIWEPEIESARQLHRLLAEESAQQGRSAEAATHREDVEATIRLARMDLSELQAINLPKQCCNCKSGDCKSACRNPGKKPAQNNEPKDARGKSLGPPADDAGN